MQEGKRSDFAGVRLRRLVFIAKIGRTERGGERGDGATVQSIISNGDGSGGFIRKGVVVVKPEVGDTLLIGYRKFTVVVHDMGGRGRQNKNRRVQHDGVAAVGGEIGERVVDDSCSVKGTQDGGIRECDFRVRELPAVEASCCPADCGELA